MNASLCTSCSAIDLKALFRHELPRLQAIPLGRLETILSRAPQCALCDLVIEAFGSPQPFYNADAQKVLKFLQEDKGGTECWLYSYKFIRDRNDQTSGLNDAMRLAITTLHPSKSHEHNRFARRTHAGDIQLMGSSALSLNTNERFYGRVVPDTLNFSLAKLWLDTCRSKHGRLCSEPGFSNEGSTFLAPPRCLTVIDVSERCLVQLPHAAEYVALSYCWSNGSSLNNVTSNCKDLHLAGSLTSSQGLSKTIDDAINCTADLGQGYLWVDQLCITQDDDEDKRVQIAQMDRVYGCAFVTIVEAPDRTETVVRLPGYRSSTSKRYQVQRQVQVLNLAIPKPCLEDVLSNTRWDTRGWTFQETFLSRRLLYFTSHQVYFQCSCNICCEDTLGEDQNPDEFVHNSTNLWNPKGRHANEPDTDYGELPLLRSRYTDEDEAIRAYSTFVSYYLRRELSFASDILNAFDGLLHMFEYSMSTGFIVGLPERWFDHAILWQLYGPGNRRTGNTVHDFPSWSWAGWDGGSEPPFWLNSHDTVALIDWYYVAGNHTPKRISTSTVKDRSLTEDLQRAELGLPGATPGAPTPIQRSLDHHYLITTTGMATFLLDGSQLELEDEGLWLDGIHAKIFDLGSRHVGIILIDKEWASGNITETSKFQFILLSRAGRARIESVPVFDQAIFDTRPFCLLNVMLIIWSDGLAERVGVGNVHEDAWREAKPTPRSIWLV